MAVLVKSRVDDSDKNFWATSPECFADARALYGVDFSIDVAAEPETSKCQRYYIPDSWWMPDSNQKARLANTTAKCAGISSLDIPWDPHWWCNPPFDQKFDFIAKAKSEAYLGNPGIMLLPYEPCTTWWCRDLSHGVIIYEPDGRYQFCERDGKTRKSGVNFACAFVLFPTNLIERSIRIPFNRGIGREFMQLGTNKGKTS